MALPRLQPRRFSEPLHVAWAQNPRHVELGEIAVDLFHPGSSPTGVGHLSSFFASQNGSMLSS